MNRPFRMEGGDFTTWKSRKPEEPGAPLIIGCIDYLFPGGTTHHQTQFAYEIDKIGPNKLFYKIQPDPGEIQTNELVLAINPIIPKDAD
jgi:hypothetical protein